ncbi:MAG: hypothetical protein PVG79_15965 [Gemmatimonadales bacterium]
MHNRVARSAGDVSNYQAKWIDGAVSWTPALAKGINALRTSPMT